MLAGSHWNVKKDSICLPIMHDVRGLSYFERHLIGTRYKLCTFRGLVYHFWISPLPVFFSLSLHYLISSLSRSFELLAQSSMCTPGQQDGIWSNFVNLRRLLLGLVEDLCPVNEKIYIFFNIYFHERYSCQIQNQPEEALIACKWLPSEGQI